MKEKLGNLVKSADPGDRALAWAAMELLLDERDEKEKAERQVVWQSQWKSFRAGLPGYLVLICTGVSAACWFVSAMKTWETWNGTAALFACFTALAMMAVQVPKQRESIIVVEHPAS